MVCIVKCKEKSNESFRSKYTRIVQISVGYPNNSETEHRTKPLKYTKMKECHKNSLLDGKAYEEIVDTRKKVAEKLI